MDLGADLSWIGICLKIFAIDVLLGGDNAIIIALACRGLPAAMVPRAVALGAVGAVFFRVVIAALAGTLLVVPVLKIACGVLLAIIAINLLAGEYARASGAASDTPDLDPQAIESNGFIGAAVVIVVVDATMSLDNVVALAAVSEGNYLYLIGGLLFSVPFLFYGSLIVSEAMKHFPALVAIGAALLGWVAGELIVSDPLWASAIRTNAEAVAVLFPAAMALFVYLEARITADARATGEASTPKRVPAPVRLPARVIKAEVAVEPRRPATVAAAAIPAKPVVNRMPSAVPFSPHGASRDEVLQERNERVVLYGLIGMFVVVAIIFVTVLIINNNIGANMD